MIAGLPHPAGLSLVAVLGSACGVAAKAATVLLEHAGYPVEEADFRKAGVSGNENGRLLACLSIFVERGWCLRKGGWWIGSSAIPNSLPAFLQGAATMRAHDGPPNQIRSVISMPGGQSRLRGALQRTGMSHVALEDTRETFLGMSAAARESLTVMTPFLNLSGAQWALDLFQATSAPRRELVIRSSDAVRSILEANAARICALNVRVLDYHIAGELGYETFHAKVVLADGRLAYVGSANLLSYDQPSMELGLVVEGEAVHPIAALVQAVRSIALPIAFRP